MSPPCRKRIQIQSWGSNRERDADYNAWDPVVWYSQRGYNVSEMIKAPANLTSRGVVRTSGTLVRAEELGIVLVVLFLWAAAIALFINRWGKIRLMEPYHPYVETQSTPQTTNAVPPANINQQGRNSLLLPGLGGNRDRRPSLLCVLEQHARRQSTLSLLSDFGNNPSRRPSTSSRVLMQGQRFNGYPRRLSNATRGPPTFLVTNYFRDGGGVLRNGRNQIHRNSETSLMRESKANHDHGDGNRSRSFDARELVSRNHGYLFGGGGTMPDYDDRRLSVSSCSKIPGTVAYRRDSDEPVLRKKRSSLDVNVIQGQYSRPTLPPAAASASVANAVPHHPQIVIPHITTEQFSENTTSLESSTETSSIQAKSNQLPNNHSNSDEWKKRPTKDWRSQSGFELSSSVESEASYIINEFLNKTKNSTGMKYESDV